MNWKTHFEVEGQHAFLGASKYHWINYNPEKLTEVYSNHLATLKGTKLHELAAMCIRMDQTLPRKHKTLNMYVNDAIGYGMRPEQPLKYSENCFGTADAIALDEKKGFLRIHDLKTGAIPAHMEQLEVYAALFCLEYHFKPGDLGMELRIYQNDEINTFNPTAEDILPIMDKIVLFDKIINEIAEED